MSPRAREGNENRRKECAPVLGVCLAVFAGSGASHQAWAKNRPFSHLDALLKGLAKNAQSPLYTVGPRYIKCPFLRFSPDNINHPFLRFGPDNINHPFLRFGPDISTTLCYASAEINQMPFCTLWPKNIYYYLIMSPENNAKIKTWVRIEPATSIFKAHC